MDVGGEHATLHRGRRRVAMAVVFAAVFGSLAALRGAYAPVTLVLRGDLDRPLRVELAWDVCSGLDGPDGEIHAGRDRFLQLFGCYFLPPLVLLELRKRAVWRSRSTSGPRK